MSLLSAVRGAPASLPGAPRRQGLRALTGRFRAAPLTAFWVLIVAMLVLPIVLFLLVAFSPRLFDQGPQWFSLSSFSQALRGPLLRGLLDSLLVGLASAVASAGIGFGVAWVVLRTDLPGARFWSGSMFALLLAPSYLIALGWERLLEPSGVLDVLGWHSPGLRNAFYGPLGIIVVLTVKGVPFAYLAISAALRGLGEQFESAVRVHGGGGFAAGRMALSLLGPAVWSALAIVFAESVSDFGVASTLANDAHFPVATFVLYNAVDNFPVQFPVAAAVGWMLMAMAGLSLLAQGRALRGRSYRVLTARSRPVRRARLRPASTATGLLIMSAFVVLSIGVPVFGAMSASLMNGLGSLATSHGFTLKNFRHALSSPDLTGPLFYSAKLATITAFLTVVLAMVSARVLVSRAASLSARVLDLLLLTAVALPGIVFAAGYIFTYNLPLTNSLGLHLYETTTLLVMGYLATALPSTSRVLTGSVSQIHESLREAARVHGIGAAGSWLRAVLPILARPLIGAWVLVFSGTLLELPVSQLLYPPNHPPVAVGIEHALSTYDYGGGTAIEVIAVLFALAVVGLVWGLFRLLAPAGWRRIGRTT